MQVQKNNKKNYSNQIFNPRSFNTFRVEKIIILSKFLFLFKSEKDKILH